MYDVDQKIQKIKALAYALQYVPGTDDNHSHCILLDMLAELINLKEGSGEQKKE